MLAELCKEYDKLQKKYGDKSLNSIYFGGCKSNPDICLVFMNPTARNITADKSWDGPRSPWIGTKNVWQLFYQIEMISEKLYLEIKSKKGKEWTKDFAEKVYKEVEKNKFYITNLAKCTQLDARGLPDKIYKKYLDLFLMEMKEVRPKKIILFGNQVSSIVLDQKISVSQVRKRKFIKDGLEYYSVYYPVGNGRFNMDKAIEDILYVKATLKKQIRKD